MKICESKPVICRASGQASADTLDNTCPCLTCDHEAPIVAGSYCLAGNMIDRNTGMNGTGVDDNVTFTLNTVDRHAVAYDARHHCLNGNVSGTLQAKGEGGWSLNYINPVIQPLPEATGADTYSPTWQVGGLRKLRSCCLSNRQCSILGNPPAQAQSICCLRYS